MNNNENFKELAEWKNTGIIKNFQGERIDFSSLKNIERTDWPKKLTIKKCLNLKYLDVSDLGLEILNVLNCPKLEELNAANNEIEEVNFRRVRRLKNLYLNNNKLTDFNAKVLSNIKNLDVSANKLTLLDLENCNKLEVLNCGINRLTSLDLNDCDNLKSLYCYTNYLRKSKLEINHLTNLKYLACQNNGIDELNASGLTELVELYCFGKKSFIENEQKILIGLKKINVKGCEKLELLDIAEGLLDELILNKHPNLETISVKQNSLKFLGVVKCPKLNYLDFASQGKWGSEKNVNQPRLISHYSTKAIISNCPDLEQLYHTRKVIFLNLDGKEISEEEFKQQFPKLRVFKCHEKENPAFDQKFDERERRKAEEKKQRAMGKTDDNDNPQKKKKKKKQEPIINDPSQLTNDYPYLLDEYGKGSEMTITHEGLTGTLIIDGYKGYKINVGNNFLSYLVVKNCPNLTTLRYAHNAMLHDAWIDNCPNLKIIDKEKYWDSSWDEDLEKLFQEGKLKGKERLSAKLNWKHKINQQVKDLLTKIEKGEVNAFQEFINSFQGEDFEFVFDNLNEECQKQFKKTFVPKLEEYAKELINKYSLDKDEFAKKVNEIIPFKDYLSAELKDKLIQLLKSIQQEYQVTKPINLPFPFYLIFILAFLRIGVELFRKKKKSKN